jgi:hypothetical protein
VRPALQLDSSGAIATVSPFRPRRDAVEGLGDAVQHHIASSIERRQRAGESVISLSFTVSMRFHDK